MRAAPRLLMVDYADSFTFMLVDYLRGLGAEVRVARGDGLGVERALSEEADGIVLSPGPGRAEAAGAAIGIAAACIAQGRPLLGVCLGHQAIALACGGRVDLVAPMHGKVAAVVHDGSGLFAGLESPFAATRYHSLAITCSGPTLVANAWSEDGAVMGVRHREAPAHGVQFHPESVASEAGRPLLAAFVEMVQQAT